MNMQVLVKAPQKDFENEVTEFIQSHGYALEYRFVETIKQGKADKERVILCFKKIGEKNVSVHEGT